MIDRVQNRAPQEPRAIAKAPEGQGCPRCGGFVYAAEQMLAKSRVGIHETLSQHYNQILNQVLSKFNHQKIPKRPKKFYEISIVYSFKKYHAIYNKLCIK